MAQAPRIPVILCIDAEPDGFFIDRRRSDPWLGYERSVEFFRRFRDRLQPSGERARFTWCYRMDPQVAETYGAAEWVARHYETITAQLIGDGDELGLHAHGYRWEAAAGAWTVDHGNQSWIDHTVRTSFAAFERAFGERCRTFRFGDRWMSNGTVRLLAELGTRHDLTLEPGHPALDSYHPGRSSGSLPDYTDLPVDPYRPSPDDFRRPARDGSGGLWLIPLTTAPSEGSIAQEVVLQDVQAGRGRGCLDRARQPRPAALPPDRRTCARSLLAALPGAGAQIQRPGHAPARQTRLGQS